MSTGGLLEELNAVLAGAGAVVVTWLEPFRALEIVNKHWEEQINTAATLAGLTGVLLVRALAATDWWRPSAKKVLVLLTSFVALLLVTFAFRAGLIHQLPADHWVIGNVIWGASYVLAAGFFCAFAVEAVRLWRSARP